MKRNLIIGIFIGLFAVSLYAGMSYHKFGVINGATRVNYVLDAYTKTDTASAGALVRHSHTYSDTLIFNEVAPNGFSYLDAFVKMDWDSGLYDDAIDSLKDHLILRLYTSMSKGMGTVLLRADTMTYYPDSVMWTAITRDSLYSMAYFEADFTDTTDLTGKHTDTNKITFNINWLLK